MAEKDIGDRGEASRTPLPRGQGRKQSSQFHLPKALLEDAVGIDAIAEWAKHDGLCLVIEAPSAEWVLPIEQYVKSLTDWGLRHSRTTKSRSSEDVVLAQVVETLALGERVLGVSQSVSQFLPSAMVSSADQTIELKQPTAKVVANVIKAISGRTPRGLTDKMLVGLDFSELASCIRRNSTATQCIARIKAAAAKKVSIDPNVASAQLVEDLHGYGQAKAWALDLIADLDAWRRGEIAFEDIDRHVVLEGPPGLGKTQFARSLARSASLPLIATSVSQWFANGPGYLDSVIKQIDASFAAARAASPAILFIDELDGVPDRATLTDRGRDWWTPVVVHLLTTLDGAASGLTAELVIMGATNYIDRVDDALLRPGRLTRIIKVEHPDQDGIVGILRHHLAGDLVNEDLVPAAQLGEGATGAEIMQWVKDARRVARRNKRSMEMADLLAIIAPLSDRTTDAELRVSIHEAGHAVVAHLQGVRVEAISLRAKGASSAHVRLDIGEILYTREEVEKNVVQLLAGRAAEEVVLGSPGVGAGGSLESDLALSTYQIGRLHLGLGLGNTLIYRADPGAVGTTLDRHPALAAAVEAELQQHYASALDLVRQNAALILTVAEEARKSGHMTGQAFARLVDGCKA